MNIKLTILTVAGDVDVGCGKKKRRVEEFRGPTLWGISLSTGCIQARDRGWPRAATLEYKTFKSLSNNLGILGIITERNVNNYIGN